MKNSQNIPFKLRLLSWLPSLIAVVIVLGIAIPVLRYALPTGFLLCKVDGTSMDTTLHHGQYMFQAGKDFSRGDIVICNILEADGSKTLLIKRIVGIPGDEVRIAPEGVYINGEKIREDYLTADAQAGTYRESLKTAIQLTQDEFFVMGDNRRVSYDSRYFGGVPREDMIYVVTAKPTLPFLLALLITAAFVVVICWIDLWLDALLLRLLCKRNPELQALVDAEKEKKKNEENKQEENKQEE